MAGHKGGWRNVSMRVKEGKRRTERRGEGGKV